MLVGAARFVLRRRHAGARKKLAQVDQPRLVEFIAVVMRPVQDPFNALLADLDSRTRERLDFGAHMGSIFYVPSGSIEAKRVTTVVWLADDAGE